MDGSEWMKMYTASLRYDVEKDLKNNSDIADQLGKLKAKFIKWCANQRIIFEADIVDEFLEFKKKFIESRLYNIDVKLWRELSKMVMIRDSFTCSYCSKVGGSLEIDHVVPISKGGTNELSNLVAACRKCNRQKRDKSREEFERWRQTR